MAFETWLKSDINRLPQVRDSGTMFTQDSGANLIGVEVYDGDTAVTLSGSVKAWIILSDGTTIQQTGSKSSNKAWVTLPNGAYAQEGHISVFIKLINGNDITTLGGIEGVVYKSM